ncbi:MAG: hypothetical protein AAB873_01300 [Patescibacteria group bacterium]
MKNKLNIILSILVAFILIPQIALASWWNPFTWFNKNTKPAVEQTVQVQQNNVLVEDKKLTEKKVSENKTLTKKVNNTDKKSKKEPNTPNIPQVVITSTPTVIDVCKNINGIQTNVSSDVRIIDDSICLPIPDLCKNVEGAQSSYIPKGMYREKDGNCYPKPIEIYLPEPQQTTQNTNPVSTPVVSPVDTTPKEITQEEMMSGFIYQWTNNDVHTLWIATDGAQKGDIVTLSFNNLTETKTVKDVSSKNSIWSGWTFDNLDFSKEYPVFIKIERGNKFTVFNGIVKN